MLFEYWTVFMLIVFKDYNSQFLVTLLFVSLLWLLGDSSAMASPGFVARRGKDWNYVVGHSRWTLTVDFGAGCSSCSMTNSFVTNAVGKRAVRGWHLHQLMSQTTQYLDNLVASQIWKSRGARAPVLHSWQRHCSSVEISYKKLIRNVSTCTLLN